MSTRKLTVLSVSTALQIVFLLITLILPTVKISMLFAASLLNGLLCSAGYKKRHVLMSFVSVCILSLILISNYIVPMSYILFFGAYGIIHFATKAKSAVVKQTIRFVYFIAGTAILFFTFKAVFTVSPFFAEPYIYFLPFAAAAGYLLFQLLYDMLIKEFFKNKYLYSLIIGNDTFNI